MQAEREVKRLQNEFPGKEIILLPVHDPTEIICEIEPASLHPDLSVAMAVIDGSEPHYHLRSRETYVIERGELVLRENGKDRLLLEGEAYTVEPLTLHSAKGDATQVKVTSEPGWVPEDHVLWKDKLQEIWALAVPYYAKSRSFDLQHVQWMTQIASLVCEKESLDPMILETAAALHDVGYSGMDTKDYRNPDVKIRHMLRGTQIASEILKKVDFPEEKMNKILYLIGHHDDWTLGENEVYKDNLLLAVLGDIDFLYLASKEGFDQVRGDMGKSPQAMVEFLKTNQKHIERPWATKTAEELFNKYLSEREIEYAASS